MENYPVKGMLILALITILGASAFAHFGMIIPSNPIIDKQTGKEVVLTLSFSHPNHEEGMPLEKPKEFGVFFDGEKHELNASLEEILSMGQKSWQAKYLVKKPDVYQFYMSPVPYWDKSEDCFILHYTKIVVPAFGCEDGWDQEIGLKAEIVPLSRPFGLYVGNVFQGIVKFNGKPVSFADVEVNFYNKGRKVSYDNSYLENQTLKCDQNGVFTCGVPSAGWWGFKAFVTPDEDLKKDGVSKKTYMAAVIWVYFNSWNISGK